LPDIPLVLVGEGSCLDEAKALAARCPNIEFVGFKNGDALYSLVGQAVASILPAEAYENCPMSILESFALGRPVIGARIGGIPELIEDGEDGLIFEPGDVDALRDCARVLWDRRGQDVMGRAARFKAEQQFTAGVHYRRISAVYESLVGR
jgi:glycosyltransferase involved in cell wall biosynthesis